MSIVISDNDDQGKPVEAATQKASPAERPTQAQGGVQAMTLGEIWKLSKSGGTIAGDTADYIDAIQSTFTRNGCGITNKQLQIEDKVIVAFYDRTGKCAVSLTLVDVGMESQREEPASDLAHQIGELLSRDGVDLMNNFVVCPIDYPHASKMARFIMLSIQNEATEAFAQVRKDCLRGVYKVTMNLGDVTTLMRGWYPLESVPRTDVGLIVWMKVHKERKTINGQDFEWEPIMVIGAYTSFVDRQESYNFSYGMGQGQPKITPVVTITSVLTSIGSPVMLGLAQMFAAEYLIVRHGWLTPYEKFGKDTPNLGALVPDAKGKPCTIKNQAELSEFLNNPNILSRPMLAMDVTEGRPGLSPQFSMIDDKDGNPPGHALLMDLASFLADNGQDVNPHVIEAGPLVVQRDVEYIGYVNGDKDSRIIDYLQLIADGASDLSSIARFLFIAPQPELKGQWISELTDYVSLFRNTTVLINPAVVQAISGAGIKIEIVDDQQSPHNNLRKYSDSAYADFSGMQSIGTHGQRVYSDSGYSPYHYNR